MSREVELTSPRAKRLRHWLVGAATVALLPALSTAPLHAAGLSEGNGVATGNTSIAISDPAGTAATASGNGSAAIGTGSTASGLGSLAFGETAVATGDNSAAIGSSTTASGTGGF